MHTLFFLWSWVSGLATATPATHPVYVSVTEIHYKPERNALEISMKIFSDDLANALTKQYNQPVEIGTDREHARANEWIAAYIRGRFSIQADGKPLAISYVGKEVERSDFFALWTYWEVTNLPAFRTLHVRNTILQEILSNQNNVITFRYGKEIKRASLVKGHAETDFNL